MSTKSRESIYGTTIRMAAERAKETRKVAVDVVARRKIIPHVRCSEKTGR
jgi:hypothetical protein